MHLRFLIFLCLALCSCAHSSLISSGITPRDFKDVSSPERVDPLETDPKYKNIFESIDAETTSALEKRHIFPQLGYCHAFWDMKKKILKRKYRLDWKSPSEINPSTSYD